VVVVVVAAGEPTGLATDVEHLKHCLHQLILSSYELLHLWVVVGIIGLVVPGMTVALIVLHVHHLRDF
jgi:hypothetical protein